MFREEPDAEEECCSCAPNAILPRIPFFPRREIPRINVIHPFGWIRLGTVKHLIIYPVDRGTGFEVDSVICTSTGPEFDTSDPYIRSIKDRRLLVYKQHSEEMEVCLDPEINIINCPLNQFHYGDIADFEINRATLLNTEKRYAGRNINIQRRRGLLENRDLQMLYRNKNRYYRVGYFPPQRRRLLNSEVRCTTENNNISGLHPNYSHFTLISNSSLQYLKDSYKKDTKNEDGNQISYLNFFPHIVLEGNSCSPYQEEFVRRVKIGNVQFGEVLPCVHNDTVNFNRTNPKKRLEDLHRYLMKSLPVSETYAAELNHYNSDMPAFGINMEKLVTGLPDNDDINRIRINDTVYVKF